MKLVCITTLAVWLCALCALSPSFANAVDKSINRSQLLRGVNAAIKKSIPNVIAGGESWMKEKKCSTCHRVTLMTWSLATAAQKGFEIDRNQLDGWIRWSIEDMFAESKNGGKVAEGNLDGVSQILISHSQGKINEFRENATSDLVQFLIKGQQKNGSWKSHGQLPQQKRAVSETIEVSTMWNTLALKTVSTSGNEDLVKNTISNALKFLADKEPGKSTEWLVAAILLANELGDQKTSAKYLTHLKETQNEDGGFGWIINEKSDALATGMGLYAFNRLGSQFDDRPVKQALNFLVETQKSDGSWEVPGTKTKAKNAIKETSSYWGTTWALIALVEFKDIANE